uniref:ATP-binding protein n=1 Tax=Rugamonas aquatica TaxID=2743357 RepID=UPI0038B5C140
MRGISGGEPSICSALNTVDFTYQPSIDKKEFQTLTSCHYIDHGDTVLMLGPPCVGKTDLAVALG